MMLYTILTGEQLDTILPQQVKEYAGYDKDYSLREAAFSVRELTNGNFVVSCKLCNAKYIANKCCETEMSETEIAMSKQFYGEKNLLTYEETCKLEYKELF